MKPPLVSSTQSVPSLTFTQPSPVQNSPVVASSETLSKVTPRLLYRGALSLPDSHLLLDGLTFSINLPADDPQASLKLLETPLPLALESMRGRPTLAFIGVERMKNICCDEHGGVNLHVHPRSILTRQLFTNNLCTSQITDVSGRSDLGIRIRLGDSEDATSSSSDIIVFGRVHPSSSVMQLCVARIVPRARAAPLPKAVSKLRPPRPDDPTPRKPPLSLFAPKRALDKIKRREKIDEAPPKKKSKREKEPDYGATASSSSRFVKGKSKESDLAPSSLTKGKVKDPVRVGAGHTLPPLPLRLAADGRDDDDVFLYESAQRNDFNELETSNKLIIKRSAVRHMAAAGITKQHPEFKEIFGFVYRGAGFALRAQMKAVPLDSLTEQLDRVVKAHVDLYCT